MEKQFYNKDFFYWKKLILKEKNINENVKNINTQKMFVLHIKYKSFLNIYSFWKKKYFDHKKYIC